MGFLRRIADAFDPPAEARSQAVLDYQNMWIGGGRVVNSRAAENLATVLACVSAVSSALASLPAFVYRVTADGKQEDAAHPLTRLVRDGPNDRQTWPDFIEWLAASTLLRGNGLAELQTDAGGRLKAMIPIPWEHVSVQLLPSGRLVYDVVETVGFYGATGRQRRLLEGEVLHLRDRSDDGLIGRSRLSRAAAVVSNALSIQTFINNLYENGANPFGVLSSDQKLTDASLERLKVQFKQAFAGPYNTARAMVLEQGLKWTGCRSSCVSPFHRRGACAFVQCSAADHW
jgi:HK97 family phage portal protein